MAEVVAFAENGYFVAKHGDRKHDVFRGLPPGLDEVVRKSKKVYCLAIGEDGDYFCAYLNKMGGIMIARRLTNYPDLDRWLESKKNRLNLPEFHCSLGPEGQFYINMSYGQLAKLDPSIVKERKACFTSGDLVKVAIGVDCAYVMVGKKGDLCWDLQGHYSDLDRALCNAKSGVKTIALSPFEGDQYYVFFEDGKAYWKLPEHNIVSAGRGKADPNCKIM